MSGLAISGDVVHGLAIGGNSFKPLVKNDDGTYTINGSKYSKQNDLIGKTIYSDDSGMIYPIPSSPSILMGSLGTHTITDVVTIDDETYVTLSDEDGLFKLSDISSYIQNGGVINSPIHRLYQTLRRAFNFRNEVKAWA